MNTKAIFAVLLVIMVGTGSYFYKQSMASKSTASNSGISIIELKVLTPYAFATTSNAKTAAAFLKITNANKVDDKLIKVSSPIAEINEIHENLIDPDDGTMMMRKIKTLNLPAQSSTILEPKGYHIMFINMNQQLKQGESFPLTLSFEKSDAQVVDVMITAPGETPRPHDNMPHKHH